MRVNHFKRQRYKKKIRRQRMRILKAQLRDNNDDNDETKPSLTNAINVEELEWLERERQAQEQWIIKQQKFSKIITEAVATQNMITVVENTTKTVSQAPRLKLPFDLPYHNPFEPEFLDQSKREICHFFRKTGMCRFDLRCSRVHETPLVSDTIVFINMFTSSSMEMMMAGGDPDISLEYDENELISEYEDFYVDVEKEFSSFGRVMTIRTCRNAMRHLRGNVYVQYRNINDAVYAFSQLNGRYYGGSQLSARFVTIESWRESICGLYFRGRCPKGGICNFMHVLLNKGESPRDLHQFLNQSASVLPRRSVRQRSRSRTCSSVDEASTPEPEEQFDDRSGRHLQMRQHSERKLTVEKSDQSPKVKDRHQHRKSQRNHSRSLKRKKHKTHRFSKRSKSSSRHHSRRQDKRNHK